MTFLRLVPPLDSDDLSALPGDIEWVCWGKDLLVEKAADAAAMQSVLEALGYTVAAADPRSDAGKATKAMRDKSASRGENGPANAQ